MHAVAVGVFGNHGDRMADLRLARSEAAPGGAGDVLAVRAPLVAERSQAVGVGDGSGHCGQHLPLSRIAGDGDGAAGKMVEIGYRHGRVAGQALRRAVAVRVARADREGFADFQLGRRKSGGGGADDRRAVGGPLIAERAQAVGVCDAPRVRGEGLSFRRVAGDVDVAGGKIVHVGNRRCGGAGQGFDRAFAVGVAGDDRDGLADLGFRQYQAAAGRAGNRGAAGLPDIVEAAEAVGVGDRADVGGKRLPLGLRAGDGDPTQRSVVGSVERHGQRQDAAGAVIVGYHQVEGFHGMIGPAQRIDGGGGGRRIGVGAGGLVDFQPAVNALQDAESRLGATSLRSPFYRVGNGVRRGDAYGDVGVGRRYRSGLRGECVVDRSVGYRQRRRAAAEDRRVVHRGDDDVQGDRGERHPDLRLIYQQSGGAGRKPAGVLIVGGVHRQAAGGAVIVGRRHEFELRGCRQSQGAAGKVGRNRRPGVGPDLEPPRALARRRGVGGNDDAAKARPRIGIDEFGREQLRDGGTGRVSLNCVLRQGQHRLVGGPGRP